MINITVEIVTENEDGSADAMVHFDREGLEFLIQYGVIDILTKYAEENPIQQPASLKPTVVKTGVTKRTRKKTNKE